MQIYSENTQKKLCKDFFPNCNTCNCFKTCFPDNKTDDIASKPFFEHEALLNKLDRFSNLDEVQKIEIVEAFTDLLEDRSLQMLADSIF